MDVIVTTVSKLVYKNSTYGTYPTYLYIKGV